MRPIKCWFGRHSWEIDKKEMRLGSMFGQKVEASHYVCACGRQGNWTMTESVNIHLINK